MTVKRIVPDLVLKDADASHAFYTEVIGLELGMDMGWIMTFGSPDVHAAQLTLMQGDATAPVAPEVTSRRPRLSGCMRPAWSATCPSSIR